jgi:Asp/Glu/hydantoin racemase
MRLLLVNPNTNAATTETMRRIAARAAPAGVDVEGLTVTRGAALITDPEALARAAEAVAEAEVAIRARAPDAVIVAAFGDPGRAALAERLAVPVIGIGEAGMRAGAAGGRRFAVVTTTPALVGSITAMAERLGLAKQFAGVELTEGDAATVTGDPMLLPGALEAASRPWGSAAARSPRPPEASPSPASRSSSRCRPPSPGRSPRRASEVEVGSRGGPSAAAIEASIPRLLPNLGADPAPAVSGARDLSHVERPFSPVTDTPTRDRSARGRIVRAPPRLARRFRSCQDVNLKSRDETLDRGPGERGRIGRNASVCVEGPLRQAA